MAASSSVQSSSSLSETETESRAREQSAEIVESASGGGESSSSTAGSVGLLLAKLRCPKSSDLARKRRVDRNPPRGKKRSCGQGASDPKSSTPRQRLREFPGEHLSVSYNKLFCLACREELSVKTSVLRSHIRSAKHLSGKTRLSKKEKTEQQHCKQVMWFCILKAKHFLKSNESIV